MQYRSECLSALNQWRIYKKIFMDAMKLFGAIPNRVNFLQLGG